MIRTFMLLMCLTGTSLLHAGGVVLTFDDFYLQAWSDFLPIFAKYDAQVTFFITEPHNFKEKQWAQLKALAKAGHRIGMHGMNHRSIIEYMKTGGKISEYISSEIESERELLERHGIRSDVFAMPFSHRTPETDSALKSCLAWSRSGLPVSRQLPSRSCDEFFISSSQLQKGMVVIGKSLDYFAEDGYPDRTVEEIAGMLDRARERDEWVVFYIHNIAEKAVNNFIKPENLELFLRLTRERNIPIRPLPLKF